VGLEMKEKPHQIINIRQKIFLRATGEINKVWQDIYVVLEIYTKELKSLFKTDNEKVSK
jgi:hypothetical protein